MKRNTLHQRVYRAAQNGLIEREPCERCGATERVHAHHDDYDKPWDIRWLCPLHHKERHKELGWGVKGIPSKKNESIYLRMRNVGEIPIIVRSIKLRLDQWQAVDKAAAIKGVSRHRFMREAMLDRAKRVTQRAGK